MSIPTIVHLQTREHNNSVLECWSSRKRVHDNCISFWLVQWPQRISQNKLKSFLNIWKFCWMYKDFFFKYSRNGRRNTENYDKLKNDEGHCKSGTYKINPSLRPSRRFVLVRHSFVYLLYSEINWKRNHHDSHKSGLILQTFTHNIYDFHLK